MYFEKIKTEIVKPDWIVDSIKEGKLLDYTGYLLYSQDPKSQLKLPFKSVNKDEITESATVAQNSVQKCEDQSVGQRTEQLMKSEQDSQIVNNADSTEKTVCTEQPSKNIRTSTKTANDAKTVKK